MAREQCPRDVDYSTRADGGTPDNCRRGGYRFTDDRTGEAMLACEGCGETWSEGRFEDGSCPDCREGGR